MRPFFAAMSVLALSSCDGGSQDHASGNMIGANASASDDGKNVAAQKFLPETGTVDLDGVESDPSLTTTDEDKREGTSRPRQDNIAKKRTGG